MATVITTNTGSVSSTADNTVLYEMAGVLIGTASPQIAIDLSGKNSSITIHGGVFGVDTGIQTGSITNDFLDGNNDIVIGATGTVDGVNLGIHMFEAFNNVTNHGLVSGRVAIQFTSAVDIAGFDRVFNFGTIRGQETGLSSLNANSLIVDNFGVISGRNEAIRGSQTDDFIENAGSIFGNVSLGGGDDEVDNSAGTIVGTVILAEGNDTFVGGAGADRVEGGSGSDDATLGAGDDFFSNGFVSSFTPDGSDTVDGGDGIDTYEAGFDFNVINLEEGFAHGSTLGHDTILNFENVNGGARADTITGSNAANVLNGRDGSDSLIGLAGEDRLSGGNGRDTIDGGLARDIMTGGAERDFFVFSSTADSNPLARQRDLITDFQAGTDRFDLSAIDANAGTGANEAFSFIGASAFTLGVAGQVRSSFISSTGKTLVEADVNGDAVADFAVQLTGLISMQAADFIL